MFAFSVSLDYTPFVGTPAIKPPAPATGPDPSAFFIPARS
jgi:hypothetical protein